jgi:hypothetical protein
MAPVRATVDANFRMFLIGFILVKASVNYYGKIFYDVDIGYMANRTPSKYLLL